MFRCFAACVPGLEPLAQRELTPFDGVIVPGGVAFAAEFTALAEKIQHLRIASTVLIRVGSFFSTSFADLETKVAALPWKTWLFADDEYEVRVSAHKSKLMHTGAIEERVRRQVALRVPEDHRRNGAANTRRILHVRFDRDRCTLSFDAAGEPLYRRGYRQQRVTAPLREDIARALVLDVLAVEQTQVANARSTDEAFRIFDPMCGSGTLLIEAAEALKQISLSGQRNYALFDTPLGLRQQYAALPETSASRADVVFVGNDINAHAIAAAKDNAERVRLHAEWHQGDALTTDWPKTMPHAPNVVLLNPPWGGRLDSKLRGISKWLDVTFPTSTVGFVAPCEHQMPDWYQSTRTTQMGGLRVKLWVRSQRR